MKETTMFNSLPELLEESGKKYAERPCIAMAYSLSYNYSELYDLSQLIATKLYGIGVAKGDKVSIVSENSPHWTASYFGILKTGAVTVPILTDFRGNEMSTILEHSEASVVFVSATQLKKFSDGFPKGIKYFIELETLTFHPVSDLQKVLKKEQSLAERITPEKIEQKIGFPEIDKDDLASIIYTSGTTGRSKGVMLSHDNLIFDAVNTGSIHKVVADDVFLSVLPLAHTFECTIGMIIPILNGASITYIDKPPVASFLGPLLAKLRPTTMLTVPMIMEKIYRVKIKPGIQASPVTRLMAKFSLTRKIVHKGAGKKLMAYFGGRMRFFGVGGAPLAPDVEKFLLEAKFPYAIGYGLTETAPMLAGFDPAGAIYRSVGHVMEGVEIKISNPDKVSGEGEIIAKGRNIMHGYYKNEEITKEVFTEDGYFRTGDLGLFDKNGILYIKGRLKNMILGPNGENIYPEEIEAVINKMDFVTDSLVMHYKGKLTAMVHLNFEQLEEKFKSLKTTAHDTQLELNKKGEELLAELLIQVNHIVSKNSKLQLMILQVDPFEKTPTLKIKRFLYKG
jgi:long-chain acyl-CoA synthetase